MHVKSVTSYQFDIPIKAWWPTYKGNQLTKHNLPPTFVCKTSIVALYGFLIELRAAAMVECQLQWHSTQDWG